MLTSFVLSKSLIWENQIFKHFSYLFFNLDMKKVEEQEKIFKKYTSPSWWAYFFRIRKTFIWNLLSINRNFVMHWVLPGGPCDWATDLWPSNRIWHSLNYNLQVYYLILISSRGLIALAYDFMYKTKVRLLFFLRLYYHN